MAQLPSSIDFPAGERSAETLQECSDEAAWRKPAESVRLKRNEKGCQEFLDSLKNPKRNLFGFLFISQ
jgi:hypothetical protein